ncbi:hypothetical protein TIFTF001_037580 [Ficus carica]|uniref:Uncharacterized protein n=1 Tax=Ficus carica TaxID=3494 RepID=A0AA88JBZ5_FICCA|nr:hypothetical protein TIFTF001_037580 [Ficus carica]
MPVDQIVDGQNLSAATRSRMKQYQDLMTGLLVQAQLERQKHFEN